MEKNHKLTWDFNRIEEAVGRIKTYINDADSASKEFCGTIQEIKELKLYLPSMYQSEKLTLRIQPEIAKMKASLEQLELDHLANIPLLENNKKIQNHIIQYLTKLGLSRYDREYNSRKKKYESITAGWLNSIYAIKTTDGYETIKRDYDSRLKQLLEWEQEQIKAKEKEAKEKELKQKEVKDKEIKLTNKCKLQLKYDLEIGADAKDILDVILDKNKYLKLAHYLRRNREDWSDGYDYAEWGIREFNIENTLDEDIHEEINKLITENEDNDGRIFRDCKYNYNFLFAKVKEDNSDLFADYELCLSLIEI